MGDFPIAEKYAAEVLSLPIYNGITLNEQQIVIDAMNRFMEASLYDTSLFGDI